MAYDYTLPDGSRIRVPDGTPLSTAESWARRDFPELYKATEAPTKQKEGFFANVGAGYKDLMANNALGIGAFGDEKAARDMRRAAAEEAKNVKTTTWEDVKAAGGIGNTLSTAGAFARDSLAGTLPYMAQTAAGAKLGSMAGSPLGPGGMLLGGAAGAVAANLPALFGMNLARQDQENPNAPLDKTAAAAAAVPQAALDAASTVFLFGRALGVNKLAGEAINKLVTKSAAEVEAKLLASAQQSLLKAGAKGAAAGAAVEMPTEVAQQVLERWQAGLALTGPEANKEYEAAAAAAVAVGGGLGPIHGIQTRSAAQATIKERDQVTADAARADALLKDEAEKQKQAEYRKAPGYLLDLDARRQAAETQVKGLRDQINSLKDFKEGTAEFEQRKALGQQVKDAVKEAKSIFAEYNPRKAEIAVLKEREGMTPDEYFEFKNYGIKPDRAAPTAAESKAELGPDEAAAGALLPSTSGLTSYQKPVDVVAQTQAVFEKALAGARFHADQTGQDITAADGVAALARNPEAVKAAQFALDNKIPLKGFDASTSRMWLKEVLKEAGKLAEEAKVADAHAETEAEAKRARFATQPTDATDPTEAWKQSLEQDNDVAGDLTRTGEYAYNGDAPSQQRLPGTPPPLEPGKVEAFAPGEYKPGTVINYPDDHVLAKQHEAYTDLRDEYERAMADYQRVAGTGSPQAIEARKKLAAISSALDEVAHQMDPSVGQSTTATPKEISDSGIDDLLNRALEPAAGNGPPTRPMDLEQSVRRLAETRSGLFQKFTAALASKFSLQQALGNIEDRKAVTVRGQLVPTEDRWEAKRDRLREADNAQKQARSELIAASIEEIKKQRELAGKLPLAHSDADLAKIISKRLDAAYANTSNLVPKEGPKTAPGLVDKDTEDKIKARMDYVQGRISELEDTIYEQQGPLTRQESDNIYAELRQLDDEQSRLQGSLREINREFDKVSKERQVALDRQLATVNARIRNMRSSNSANMRGELGRLKAARRSILERQSMGTSEAMLHEALQNIITNLTVNRNLPTRANAVKEGLRKGATGKVSSLRELVLGGRQFPGREVETGSTEFGEAYGLKSGEEQFKASKDDTALVQRMREEELAELNDAAKDPRYDAKTQERIDNAIAALYGRLNDPVTEGDVARAKERYGYGKNKTYARGDQEAYDPTKPPLENTIEAQAPHWRDRSSEENTRYLNASQEAYDATREQRGAARDDQTPDLFGENLPKDIERAGSEYDAARAAADTGKKEFGQALGGLSHKALVDAGYGPATFKEARSRYRAAKARLDAIRAKLPALKKSQEDARSEVHAAVDAKVSNDAMEADARLKATQRTAAAVLQQMKQRRDAATGPEAKAEAAENMRLVSALLKELNEDVLPQLKEVKKQLELADGATASLKDKTEADSGAFSDAAVLGALEDTERRGIADLEQRIKELDALAEKGENVSKADTDAALAQFKDVDARIKAAREWADKIRNRAPAEQMNVARDWAAKVRAGAAPLIKKLASIETTVSEIKAAIAEVAPGTNASVSNIVTMVAEGRKLFTVMKEAEAKVNEAAAEMEVDPNPSNATKHRAKIDKLKFALGVAQDAYYKQMQAVREAGTRANNPAALKAADAIEKRYEESVERAGELQRRLEALYKPESRVDVKGLWPADKFGTAVEPPTPQVVRGTYGTAYAKDRSGQTEDARKAAEDKRLAKKAESGIPAIEFNGQKEMTIIVPEETSTEVRFKLAEWLRSKGHTEAADRIEGDAVEITLDDWILTGRTWAKENKKSTKPRANKTDTVTLREDYTEAELEKMKKAATAQFNAAVRIGEKQTAVRPQRSKASSKLNTGVKRGRPTKDAEENTRLGLGEMSVGDVNAPDVESRVDKNTIFAPQDEGVQPDLTVGQIKAAKAHSLNKMSHSEAAQWLAERIKNPLKKALAMRVAHFLKNSKGTIEFSAEFDDKGPGSYNNYQKRVTLSPRIVNDEAALADVLLHELTHAATMAGMRLNPMLRAQMGKLVEHVSKWLETTEGKAYAEAHPELLTNGEIYGLKNIDEFVAETFSSSAFQQLLNQIPEQKVSALERFVRFLGRLFGANTPAEIKTLESVLKLSEKAMKETRRANEGGIGRLEGTAGMYVGESANMPEPMRILGEKAKAMLAKGMSKEEIWDKTGWFQSGDGKWRVEISDEDVAATPEFVDALAMNTVGTHKLSDLLAADRLYNAYPALKNMTVELYSDKADRSLGSFSKSANTAKINLAGAKTVADIEETLLHEIQHYVQDVEGFSSGTNSTATYLNLSEPESARKAAAAFTNKNMPKKAALMNRVADSMEEINAEKQEAEKASAMQRKEAEKKYEALIEKQKAQQKTRPTHPKMPDFPGIDASDAVYSAYEAEVEKYKSAAAAYHSEMDAYEKTADALRLDIKEAHNEVMRAITNAYSNITKKYNSRKDALWDAAQKEETYLKLLAAEVLYENKHGELEARDTTARKNLTAAERRATTPYKSTGVQADEVVYAPKRQYANSDLESAVGVMVGGRKDKLAEIRAHATGLEFRVRFIDAYAGIKEALKAGDPVKAIQVTYDLMTFAQRNHVVQQAVMFGTPTRAWWGKLHGKDVYKTEVQEGASLKNVSDMLGKVKGFGNSQATSDAFTLYALAKRAQTDGWDRVFADLSVPLKAGPAQVAEIEKENARRQKARAYADTLANDKDSPFKLVYKEYQDWNKGMLQFAQQAGIISEEEFRRLAAKQNYTPLFRADKFGNMVLEIDQGRDITVGRLADEPHMQKMLGGSGQVMDFFTASVRNASVIIDASLHNIASREAAMSLYAMGAAHPVSATEKGDNIVEFRGPDKDGKVDLQRFAVDTAGTAAGHIPTNLLVRGFAGVPASLPGFVRMMGVPAQVLRKAVTRNPLYMVRQLIRDPMSAYLTTGAKFNPVTDTLSELGKALQGTADRTLDRRGITGGALFAENETDLERLQNEAKNNGNWWNIGYYMAALDHGAHAADAITRRNVYNGAIKEGASEIEATLAAYESMPFSKRGTSPSARYLNHMIPFLSAMIQGWDVMYRAAKGDMPLHERVNVRNKLLARGTMIAGITMMYAMANADDEAYQNANTSERLNNWLVRIPGMDNPLKVPIPFELGVIFKMIPEAMVRVAMSDKDLGQEARDIGAALANMAPNLLMPQAMLPVTEAMLNRSFFTGRDIEGRALQNVDIGQRYDKNTSELSKALGFDFDLFGTQVGVSPKMLEYMASQYTGGLYGALAAVVDNVLPAGDKEKPDRTLAQMPLFKTVLLQEDAGGEVNRLYDKIEKFTRTEATFKKMIAEGDGEGAKRYAEDNREEFGKAKVASAAKAVLDKFSTMEKSIRASDWDGAKKKAALDNIQRIKSSLAEKYAAAL